MKIKRIDFVAKAKAELVDAILEKPEGEDYILVKKYITTVSCGTERANLMANPNVAGEYGPVPLENYFPRSVGYSCAGVVAEVGKNVTKVKVGDRVCTSWGVHATYGYYTENAVSLIPDELSFREAATLHITTFPLAGVRKTGLELGESAMTVGLGILGMFSIQFMKAAGACPVIAADLNTERRKLALELGADYAFDPSEDDFVENIRRVTGGRMINAAVEVTGNGQALDRTLDVMAHFGRVALLGCTRESDFTIDYYKKIHAPGITLIGAHTAARPSVDTYDRYWTEKDDREASIRLVTSGRVDIQKMLDHGELHSPAECAEVYDRLAYDKKFPVVAQFDWTLLDK